MTKFCVNRKEHTTETINCEKKKMLPLKSKGKKSYTKQIFCHRREQFNRKFNKD